MANGKQKSKRNGGNPGKKGKRRLQSRAAGLSNGTGALSVHKPYGNSKGEMLKHGLDAFHNLHVPLPRAVAPYITVRTVRTFSSAHKFFLFGPMRLNAGNERTWTNFIGISSDTPASLLNSNSFDRWTTNIPGSESAGFLECTPAAYSVQLMNDSALQTADGVFYSGRLKTGLTAPDSADTRTTQSLMDGCVAYSPPRILTGGKLALGAVQMDAVPGNMAAMADFTPIAYYPDQINQLWTNATGVEFEGFNPMYLVNNDAKTLQFMVATEWRVRVSPFNPMSSSAIQHTPTSDSLWSEMMQTASRIGHGVKDVINVIDEFL
jgi:hypothetical protein